MNKNIILFLIIISISLSIKIKSQETSCYYTEKNANSNGYICSNDILYFTSNIETIVAGEISANYTIIITPKPHAEITFKANNTNCNGCAEPSDGTGTTIKSRGSGGGKNTSNKTITPSEDLRIQSIKVKKNPVKDILELVVPDIINISTIEMYDSSGKTIKQSTILNKNHKINCSSFPNGKYWILITTTENKKYILNFIKN